MTGAQFHKLIRKRWFEISDAFDCDPDLLRYEFGDYPHFKKKRGFGVTFCYDRPKHCMMRLAPKLLRSDEARVEGIVRHELGHVIDHLVPSRLVESRLGKLPKTPELKADAIAGKFWGQPLKYDQDEVQTIRNGTPRPRHLGL